MKSLKLSNEAVSPVVGVMLMLVVTLIIAAIVSGFAGSMVSSSSITPQAIITAEYSQANGMIITHSGGDSLPLGQVKFATMPGEVMGPDYLQFLYNIDMSGINYTASDGESKALMKNCKAFIFPSVYEGFGIPPLEALLCGAKVLCSNATCLPEIYEDTVVYFDPYDYDADIDELLKKPVANPAKIFKKCSWERAAERWRKIILNEMKAKKDPLSAKTDKG